MSFRCSYGALLTHLWQQIVHHRSQLLISILPTLHDYNNNIDPQNSLGSEQQSIYGIIFVRLPLRKENIEVYKLNKLQSIQLSSDEP